MQVGKYPRKVDICSTRNIVTFMKQQSDLHTKAVDS